MSDNTKQIEHLPATKPQGRARRFWNRRSYGFKATAYGFAGAAPAALTIAAAEILDPAVGSFVRNLFNIAENTTALGVPLSFYLAMKEVHKHHPILSQVVGEEDASLITWSAAAGVGLPHWYQGMIGPLTLSSVYRATKPLVEAGQGKLAYVPGGMLLLFAFACAPYGARLLKNSVEEYLRDKFQVYPKHTVSDDPSISQEKPSPQHPKDGNPSAKRLSKPDDSLKFRM